MDAKKHGEERIHQVLVKFLDGKHRILNFSTPTITIETLKHKIQSLTSIPSHLQLLLLPFNRPTLLHNDHQILNLRNHDFHSTRVDNFPLVVNLLLRLRGGKGGFGSLLRGAATKAGQKKTNNFDACRDMSGRRLRHVNAEKKLEEWMAEAEERKLEKMAVEYIKNKAKELKKGKGKGGKDIDKYLNKYREDSAKCMEEVEKSVRESIESLVASKRKNADTKESNSKRLKIWMGKRKLGDSDSEDMDDDDEDSDEDEEENNKSDVTENGNLSDSSKETDQNLGSLIDTKCDMVSADGVLPLEVCTDGEKVMEVEQHQCTDGNSNECAKVTNDASQPPGLVVSQEETSKEDPNKFYLEMPPAISGTTRDEVPEIDSVNIIERVSQETTLSSSSSGEKETFGADIKEEVITATADSVQSEKSLNLQEFDSASELEVLGMERLKSELQAHGLKCGGTLQERAARLFLLKSTALELLPKKFLVKK